MDCEQRVRMESSGRQVVEIIVFPGADVSEPEIDSENEHESKSDEDVDDSLLFLIDDEESSRSSVVWMKRQLKQVDCTWRQSFSEVRKLLSPIEYFKNFFTNDMFEAIAEQSALYATQNGRLTMKFSTCDIEQLTGILMKMGLVPMSPYWMYWSRAFRLEGIASRMSRFRFFELMKYLHFNDNSKAILNRESPSYDRLYKVRPLLEQFRNCCLKVENEEKQAIDKQIIPFKGKHKLKIFTPRKPRRWGFKLFSRCRISGILYDFAFYELCRPKVEKSVGFVPGDFVIKLCEHLPKQQNHKLFLIIISILLNFSCGLRKKVYGHAEQ
ncbi:PiggyBac transposable element-derived protein 3 [Trichinella zimbabwensis]|uniref:PiggyBac transposable element-derived protein 3 n=1 Tax=Trichinella zimbabwensis TaxID=268475 RepID=A0A0V1I7I2_9BILA|nr:PiggyBac transposable element-derived protein 3 [Trichinella zimbabwensis]